MPTPRRQAEEGAEPRAWVGAPPSQILVPKQAHSNEGRERERDREIERERD